MALLRAMRPAEDVPRPFSRGCSGGCLVQALAERGISYQYLHSANVTNKEVKGTVVEFHINGATYYFGGGCLRVSDPSGLRVPGPRIDGAAARITRKKGLVKVFLRKHDISVPEGTVFFRDGQHRAESWFQSHISAMPYGICVKPADGKWGHQVYVGIRDLNSFRAAFAHVGRYYERILVEETVPGPVYRFNCLGGRVVGVEIGRPPNVEGDGIHTIAELVELKNAERRLNPAHASTLLRLGRYELRFLSGFGVAPNHAPAAGELVFLSKASNLHQGGECIDATHAVHQSYIELIEQVMKLLPDLVLCGVDVTIPDVGVPVTSDNYHILELNRGPGLSTSHYPWRGQPRDLAGAIIDYLADTERFGERPKPAAPQTSRFRQVMAVLIGRGQAAMAVPAAPMRFASGSSGDCLLQALAARGLAYHYLSPDQITDPTLKGAIIAAFSINGVTYYFDGGSLRVSDPRGVRVPGPTIDGPTVRFFKKDLVKSFLHERGVSFPTGDAHVGRHDLASSTASVSESSKRGWIEETESRQVYRFMCVAGRVVGIEVGRPANVEGDGIHTIAELVELKNAERRLNRAHATTLLPHGPRERTFLSGVGLGPEHVPEAGELVFLSNASNMHQGGEFIDARDAVHQSYIELVEQVLNLLPDLVLCSVEVAIRDAGQQATRDNYYILDLNSRPGFSTYHYPWRGQSRDVARAIVDYLTRLKCGDGPL